MLRRVASNLNLINFQGKFLRINDFNHIDKISKFQNPLLILHTQHDHLVGVHHAKALYEAATCEKDMLIFPQGNHNTIFYANADLYMEKIRDFVDEL